MFMGKPLPEGAEMYFDLEYIEQMMADKSEEDSDDEIE